MPNGEGVASGGATRVLKKSCSINSKKFKNLRVFTPKPLRTKSTLHHWTCGAFGMRGRSVLDKSRPAAAPRKIVFEKINKTLLIILSNKLLFCFKNEPTSLHQNILSVFFCFNICRTCIFDNRKHSYDTWI